MSSYPHQTPAPCIAHSMTTRAPQGSGRLALEGPDAVRKAGDASLLGREVEAMDYVRRHTSIPIPAVIQACLGDGSENQQSWILMQRLPGVQLDVAWPKMTDKAQAETRRQLKSYLRQLRQLGSPQSSNGRIGSASGGPAYDHRLSSLTTVGPFASVAEFHDFLVSPISQCPRPAWVSKYRGQLVDTYQVHFAHADLSWENILVDVSTGNVTGILDWEMAGFWPEWWEYRKAIFGARSGQPWWVRLLKDVMTEYPKEADVDMDLEMF